VVRAAALRVRTTGIACYAWPLFVLLSACSDRLELGHDAPDVSGSSAPNGASVTATCDGEPCFRGPVRQLADVGAIARSVALDGDNVYWAAPDEQALMITPRGGGETAAVQVPAGGPYRVIADGNYVFFSGDTGGYVAAVSKKTHNVQLVATDQLAPRGLAVGSAIFFSDASEGTIKRAGYDSTTPENVSTGQAIETLVSGLDEGAELAIGTGYLYYSDPAAGVIAAVDRGSDEVVTLARGLSRPGALLPRGDYLYFLEQGTEAQMFVDGRLLRMPLDGGDVDLLVDALAAPSALAADDTSLYVATRGSSDGGVAGRIVRFGDDGQLDVLAVDQSDAMSIAVDDAAIYWTVERQGGPFELKR
jgi:hypothetical protein